VLNNNCHAPPSQTPRLPHTFQEGRRVEEAWEWREVEIREEPSSFRSHLIYQINVNNVNDDHASGF
jgi:hypothetical protein